jgi:putative sigma-54 modulation protein
MKVSIKGMSQELSPKLRKKLDAKFAKVGKLLEKRGEQEAHVVVTSERHLHRVEITLPFYEHKLVGMGSDADLQNALFEAVDKLEAQAVKNRGRWREKKRRADVEIPAEAPVKMSGKASDKKSAKKSAKKSPEIAAVLASSRKKEGTQRIFRVNHHDERKPMTLDEAVLEMEKDQDYMVYRDADKDKVSVLVRRRDGHFDLIEG